MTFSGPHWFVSLISELCNFLCRYLFTDNQLLSKSCLHSVRPIRAKNFVLVFCKFIVNLSFLIDFELLDLYYIYLKNPSYSVKCKCD